MRADCFPCLPALMAFKGGGQGQVLQPLPLLGVEKYLGCTTACLARRSQRRDEQMGR